MCARFDRMIVVALFSLVSASCQASLPQATGSDAALLTAELSTAIAADGAVVLVRAAVPSKLRESVKEEDITGKFGNISLPFFQVQPGVFEAVLGVPYGFKPGAQDVEVVLRGAENRESQVKVSLTVIDGNYASEKLRVNPKKLNPTRKDLLRIRKEQKEVGAIYRTLIREKYWDGSLKFPIESAITSVYGTKRVFNGEFASFHSGTDLRAAVGTPVHAPARGKVVLAKDLFFSGKTVMLDHGYGVVTFYAHLDKFRVKPGQVVGVGDLLGLSGVTGRVSGPHLHWSAVVHGAKVNPLELMKVLK